MSYRPITDMWVLARPKVKYYGAYPAGFLERARALLGVSYNDSVLHVCGGLVKKYPYKRRAWGRKDKTLDIDPTCSPDYLQDAREPFPCPYLWGGVLIDQPYTEEDADHYNCGRDILPNPNLLLKEGLRVVREGGRVGTLHYVLPRPPKEAIFVACVGVIVGYGNKIRCFSVFEKPRREYERETEKEKKEEFQF